MIVARNFAEIQRELSELSPEQRAKLALALVESLEPEDEGDIAEAWREGPDQFATASLKYESRDIVRDRTTGQIVSGDDRVSATTEIWTFVRRGSGPWLVSAIQET